MILSLWAGRNQCFHQRTEGSMDINFILINTKVDSRGRNVWSKGDKNHQDHTHTPTHPPTHPYPTCIHVYTHTPTTYIHTPHILGPTDIGSSESVVPVHSLSPEREETQESMGIGTSTNQGKSNVWLYFPRAQQVQVLCVFCVREDMPIAAGHATCETTLYVRIPTNSSHNLCGNSRHWIH